MDVTPSPNFLLDPSIMCHRQSTEKNTARFLNYSLYQ